MIAWPLIPTVENGMPFSGLHHSLYGEAVNYLLGVNHGREVFWRLHEQTSWWETGHTAWQTLWEGWLYYRGESPILGYALELYNEAAYTTTAQLQWLDGEVWTDLGAPLTATGTSLGWKNGGIDISGLGWDGLIRLRWRVRSSNAAGYAGLRMWFLGVRGSLSGWKPLGAFSERLSDASEWNDLRDNLDMLYRQRGSAPQPLALGARRCEIEPSDVWRTVTRYCCYYRGGNGTAAIQIKGPTTLNGAKWRVLYRQQGAGGFSTLYTSGNIHGQPTWGWFQTTLDLSGLTPETWYEFAIEAYRDQGWGMYARASYIVREPPDGPALGWQTPPLWTHGDLTVTVENCQILNDDAEMLYDGDEELWGQNAAQQDRPVGTLVHPLPSPEVNSLQHPAVHTGVRRWRWLHYRCADDFDEPPALIYGPGLEDKETLPYEEDWVLFDLESVPGLLVGDVYQVEHVRCALETQDA